MTNKISNSGGHSGWPNLSHYHYGRFPPRDSGIDWMTLIPLIGPANAALARYDGTLSAIPNANVLLSPLSTQEAVLPSRIEGTQATMGEALEFEAEGDTDNISIERKEDIIKISIIVRQCGGPLIC
ncbi:MAG: Fic/DOC family N-terminal domain-containing protein [Syntrophobacter sp.]